MKLSPVASVRWVPVLALAGVLLGCAVQIEDGEESPSVPATVSETPLPTVGANLALATNGPFEAPLIAPSGTNPVATAQPLVSEPVKPPVQLSERLEAVVKLAHSGVGDDVILAFIENSTSPFNPTPDEIVYLTDVGLSDAVITALVNHRGITSAAPAGAPMAVAPPPPYIPPAAPDQPVPPTEATYNPEPPVMYSEPPVVDYGTPPPPTEDDYFYPALAPYGNWVQVPDYGYCWQPTVAVIHSGWQPYCDHGHWLYTDCGWYWQSDYSWGWAPFHYGRWFRHPHQGWCWRPDSVWAPAWVAWRYTDSHCGWAPLPPGAHYHEGVGFTYYGAHVGVGFSFGLHREAWTFVPLGQMHEREVWRHRVPPAEHAVVYTHSRPVSNYAFDHHTVVNKGLDPSRVPGFGSGEARKVVVRDAPQSGAVSIRPDRMHLEGAQLVVYRPKPPAPPSTQPQSVKAGESTTARSVASRPANTSGSGGSPAASGLAAGFNARSRSEPPVPTAAPKTQPGTTVPGNVSAPKSGEESRAIGTVSARPQFATSRPPTVTTTPSWSQARAVPESTTPPWQRPRALQAVGQPSPAVRQEVPSPATTVAPERSDAPIQANRPVFSGNSAGVRSAPWTGPGMNPQPRYTVPQATHAAPSYNPPVAPAQVIPAPSYSPAPVQSRPSQPVQTYTPPVSRPAPQAAPAPAPSSNRRQN